MIPKLVITKDTKEKTHYNSKEDLLREKVDELLKENEKMKKELEELKNMI